ncbi:hypothetical protein [Nostoc sp. DedSLP04]|uniref:hypothetical protein n=1 Tax=Nostoc sp. DedSLP04 TaxID=3075401 RepID=UPI002AD42CCC|nr:hypothetical protein [Nostoc sp. DedSLP04]MDZ8033602.1 hypothetical protein [Nostoc sp. DedSLP04]
MKLRSQHKLLGFIPLLFTLGLTTPVISFSSPALASEFSLQSEPYDPLKTHLELFTEPWSQNPTVKAALQADNGNLQLLTKNKKVFYDEISVLVDKMPQGLTPTDFLLEIAKDPNGAINYQSFDDYLSSGDDTLNQLIPRNTSTPPKVGDIYDIKLRLFAALGLPNYEDDVSVMLTDLTDDHFTLSTITSGVTGKHPVNGSRKFGFKENPDGTLTFYTNSVTQLTNVFGDFGGDFGGPPEMGWTNYIKGLSQEVRNRGGESEESTLRKFTATYPGLPVSSIAVPEPTSTLGILGFTAYIATNLVRKTRQKNRTLIKSEKSNKIFRVKEFR